MQILSKKGVHIHMKKKHGQKFECDLCEKVFDSVIEGKIHRKLTLLKADIKPWKERNKFVIIVISVAIVFIQWRCT